MIMDRTSIIDLRFVRFEQSPNLACIIIWSSWIFCFVSCWML